MRYILSLLLVTAVWSEPAVAANIPAIGDHSIQQAKHSKETSLVLYLSPSCPFCQKVQNYLDKIGKSVPMRNTQTDPKARADLKKIGGKTQVPCLVIDGKALYESDAIIAWLSKHQKDL